MGNLGHLSMVTIALFHQIFIGFSHLTMFVKLDMYRHRFTASMTEYFGIWILALGRQSVMHLPD